MSKANWIEFPEGRGRRPRTSCAVRRTNSGYQMLICSEALRVFDGATHVHRMVDPKRKLVGLRAGKKGENGVMRIWYTGRGITGYVSVGNLSVILGIDALAADGMVKVPHFDEDGVLILDFSTLAQTEGDADQIE